MRISSPRIPKDVSPTKNFEGPRKYSDQLLQDIAGNISKRADIGTLSVAICELYLNALQRVIDVRSDLDRAREVKAGNDPRWKNAMRTARFACRDEEKLLCLVDRAIRGLCECLGMRTRISFEAISEINSRKYQDPPVQLRQEQTRLLVRNAILTKAILYNLTLPEEYLKQGMDRELKAYVDDKIENAG